MNSVIPVSGSVTEYSRCSIEYNAKQTELELRYKTFKKSLHCNPLLVLHVCGYTGNGNMWNLLDILFVALLKHILMRYGWFVIMVIVNKDFDDIWLEKTHAGTRVEKSSSWSYKQMNKNTY